jgi:ArsR family transcriptional regulator, arsenate/arsenite/antimonite-responsive transcriptional repressor
MTTTEDFARTLKMLGNPTRLRIAAALIDGSCSVSLLCQRLELPQATVSQHLALLCNNEIVSASRDGVHVCYTLRDRRAEQILKLMKQNQDDGGGAYARS